MARTGREDMDAHTALRATPLFAALEDRHIEALTRIATCREVPSGTRVTVEGKEHALAMFIILNGKVEVRREGTTLTALGPGENFGEMALFVPDLPRSADVVAMEDTELLQLTRWDIQPFVKEYPEVALAVIEQLANRLVDADHRLATR
jgi:CRP/FNR family cyclic AMP-dependent transcriptional regulator